eukprot:757588-Hanusia_phi.AAC.5
MGLVQIFFHGIRCHRRDVENEMIMKNKFIEASMMVSNFGSKGITQPTKFDDCVEDFRSEANDSFDDAVSK